jgi:L-arabinose isomerase
MKELGQFMNVAVAVNESKFLKVVRFGDNMRQVAVTEGDKVEAEIKFGWAINFHAVGDLVEVVNAVSEEDVNALVEEYKTIYNIPDQSDEAMASIAYQARLEIGMEKFLVDGDFGAFTTTFEDLHGLKQLPGLAVQRLMAKGYGFAGEGDWKTAALLRITKIMAGKEVKGTSFMEDYTYHMEDGNPMVLGAHMLEICPSIANDKPSIIVKHLGIGGKDAPARMTFKSQTGPALNASLVDMGGRMRLIINRVEAIEAPFDMPNLPVAQTMWQPLPNFEDGIKGWILAGGAHHTVYSYDVTTQDLVDFAEFLDIETVVIDDKTDIVRFKQELKISDLVWSAKN